jgi:Raf kinase inhibitor-like YbhB/YbcL family protein
MSMDGQETQAGHSHRLNPIDGARCLGSHPVRRTGVISLTCIAAALIGAGCNHDGRTLRPARPDQNQTISTTAAPTTTPFGTDVVGGGFSSTSLGGVLATSSTTIGDGVASAAASVLAPWRDGAAIDPRYTCSGLNVSPPLSWTPAPPGTAEIAITLSDEQKPDFVHWAVAAIDPDVTAIGEGRLPDGAIQATNGSGGVGYTGPCPPAGETHTYVLTVHYLASQIELGDGATGADMVAAIDAATFQSAEVTGTFAKV